MLWNECAVLWENVRDDAAHWREEEEQMVGGHSQCFSEGGRHSNGVPANALRRLDQWRT